MIIHGRSLPPFFVTLLILAIPLASFSMGSEEVGFDSPEGWAMKYFTAVGAMHSNGPPLGLEKGKWAVGFETANIPHLSKEKRTVGFNGTKEEDLNKAPLIARPLLHYGITNRLSATVSYVPPISVFDGLTTHLGGISLNYDLIRAKRTVLAMRLVAQGSEAKGDFTAPAEIVGSPDPDLNPFEAISPSEDTYTSWTGSLEATLYHQLMRDGPVFGFLSASYLYGEVEFDVYVPQPENNVHTNHLETTGGFWIFGIGMDYRATERIDLRAAVTYAPLDVQRPPNFENTTDALLNLRLTLSYRL